jgi:hypothetical protein
MMSNLPEIYNESIDLFYKTFDVPKLVFEIISNIKNPAACGKLYEVEVVSAKQEGFRIKIEFKTNEDTYFTQAFNLENRLDSADGFLGQLGCSLSTINSVIGRKFKVFYENPFNTIILGRI